MRVMTTAKSDQIAGIVSRLKLSAWWTILASSEFGLELGRVIWKPHDDFYPLTVVLWGGVTVFSFLMCRSALVGLPYAVTLTEAGAMRLKTRGVLMVIFSAACISFCFGLCALASKRLGGLFPVAA